MRKFLLSFLALLVLVSMSTHQARADIDIEADIIKPFQIGRKQYSFAFNDENNMMRLWEFIPYGEALDNWNTLASFAQYKVALPVNKLGKIMAASVKEQGGKIIGIKQEGSASLLIAFILPDGDDNFSEVNIWQYQQMQGAVVAYQLAFRFYGDSHKDEATFAIKHNMNAWLKDFKESQYPKLNDLMALVEQQKS